MRDVVRRVVAAVVPAVVVALLWGRMEDPVAAGTLAAVAVLGVVPAAVAALRARIAAAVVIAVVGLSVAFTTSPYAMLPRTSGTWFGVLLTDAADGLRAFERLPVPFDPAARPEMHGLVLTAVLVFALAAALATAAGRPLLAAVAVIVGGGWATASVSDGGHELALGALLLTGALWPLLVLRTRTAAEAARGAAVLVVVAALGVGAAAAGAVPSAPYLDWKNWSLVGSSSNRIGVKYVWDASYEGIRFPSRRTTVLRVRADRSALYWRASTLDIFTADRWLENLFPITIAAPTRRLPSDPLLPVAAADEESWVEQEVEVVNLDDSRLIGAAQPVRVESAALPRVFFMSGGVMQALDGVQKGERYTIWSYSPRPLPRDLLSSRPQYPPEALRYLSIDRALLPAFGAPGRDAEVEELFDRDLYTPLRPYRPVWEEAQRVAGDAQSPYEATLAVEQWLRTAGGFRYEELPPPGQGPPLVDFVVDHRSGYCQHFAGTMALMLRLLGVPARVAVGFTSGRWKDGVWDVADRDAHAWVEAWFEGHGWITFDPTPGRGTLTAGYTFASDSAETVRALGRGELLDIDLDFSGTGTAAAVPVTRESDADSGRAGAIVALVLLGAVAALAALVLLKLALRRLRYVSRDPRRVALAVRLELEDVLRDQGVALRTGAGLGELRAATESGIGVPATALVDAIAHARFGPPERAARGAAEARRELHRVLELARERLGPGRRLRGILSVRSLRLR